MQTAWQDKHITQQLPFLLFSFLHKAAVALQGMVTLALSTWIPGLQPTHEGDTANWLQNLALYGSLYIVALGTGGIKPNVSAFGADQFDMSDAKVCCFPSRPVSSWQHALRNCGLRLSPGSQEGILTMSYSGCFGTSPQQPAQLGSIIAQQHQCCTSYAVTRTAPACIS